MIKDHRPETRKGMVLFELMIALFVFVVVAFSLVMALDASMTASRERNQAAAVVGGMRNQFTLLRAASIIPCDRDLSNDGSGIAYHLLIEPAQLKDQKGQPVPNIYQATITAKWKLDGQPEDRSVSQLIYQP